MLLAAARCSGPVAVAPRQRPAHSARSQGASCVARGGVIAAPAVAISDETMVSTMTASECRVGIDAGKGVLALDCTLPLPYPIPCLAPYLPLPYPTPSLPTLPLPYPTTLPLPLLPPTLPLPYALPLLERGAPVVSPCQVRSTWLAARGRLRPCTASVRPTSAAPRQHAPHERTLRRRIRQILVLP